jgi:ElaB/YqjD/DUF883 family membrane-anchored ribosome-binding protein
VIDEDRLSKGVGMKQAANETGSEGLIDNASERLQDAGAAAQDKASELRVQGSLRLRDQLDQRSSQAGSQVQSLSQVLRRSGEELHTQGNDGAARATDWAGERAERLGSYLEQTSGEELFRDVEAFTRRRPWMLAGLGLLAGVAAARFMKASSDRRYDSYKGARQAWPTPAGVSSPYGTEGEAEVSNDVLGSETARAALRARPGVEAS